MRKPPITITTDRDTIRSSSEFRDFVDAQRIEAARRRDDRLQEVAEKRLDIKRAVDDHNAGMVRINTEIAGLLELVADDDEILAAAGRALTLRPAPQILEHEMEKANDPAVG